MSPLTSPSGSLSDESITLCLPALDNLPPLNGGVPSTNLLAAASLGKPAPPR